VTIIHAIGVLAAASGIVVVLFLVNMPRASRLFVALAIALLAGGIGVVLRYRWAGMLIAALSLAAAIGDLASLARCSDCDARTLLVNAVVAILCAAPGILILRWRKLLR
jgi:hypothetical protein